MTDANAANTNSADSPDVGKQWINAWLETQRDWLARWQSVSVEQRTDAMRAGMETLREHLDPQSPSPEALNLAHSFQQLLHTSLQASGEWARLQSENQTGSWLNAPSLGPLREQQLAWQSWLRAQLDYQLHLKVLVGAYAQVFTEALNAVPAQAAARAEQGRPLQGFRDLYELWVECGEAVFARLAQDEAFITAQADCSNALSRMKQAQGVLIEQWLKAFDLPTRSELNSVHQRLRDLQARITELEHIRDAHSAAPTGPAHE